MNDYISTRDAHQSVSSKQAILNGMSPDGGLYVLPTLDQIHLDLSLICTMSYKENAVYLPLKSKTIACFFVNFS